MLVDISIRDLGVIHQASAELAPGLTVLTGETGAGKTMVVTGLRLLAGGRADASRVRSGSDKAVVEGTFSVGELAPDDADDVAELVGEAGGQADENGEYLAARTVAATGRSKAHLGGRAVPAQTLAQFSQTLLTIHGQNDQLRLLAPDQQLAALDRSDPEIAPLRETYRASFVSWRDKARDLKRRVEKRRELAREADQLTFALKEIDEVSPEPGEEAELVDNIARLQDIDTLREAASSALMCINGPEDAGGYTEQDSAASQLGQAAHALAGTEDKQLKGLGDQLSELTSQLGDIAGELGTFLDQLPADPRQLEDFLQRQQQLRQLTRKYAADIDGVLSWRDKAAAKLASLDTSSEALEKMAADVAAAEEEMKKHASALTAARTSAAAKLAKAVTAELHGLAMPKARCEVDIRPAKYSKTGADEVELMLAANAQASPAPLASAASGGELSRVMLALEVILSAGSAGTTLVFDEVDAGVGGRAAVEIGRRLARLALRHQVIVVTHLPQVAAYAGTHLHVAKDVTDESVTSGVATLTPEQRVEELARMLAGLDDTETGRAHAQELFDRAQAEAAEFRAPTTP